MTHGRPKVAATALAAILAMTVSVAAHEINDYPTEARADYVFACMASNGQTQDALRRCSCSIDVIATILPYDSYVEADTVLRMRLIGGEKSVIFKDSEGTKRMVENLRRAQAESEIRCF